MRTIICAFLVFSMCSLDSYFKLEQLGGGGLTGAFVTSIIICLLQDINELWGRWLG